MSAYILYQNQTIPEKWGDSLGIVQCQDRSGGVLLSLFVATRWRQDLLLGGRDWPSRSSSCSAVSVRSRSSELGPQVVEPPNCPDAGWAPNGCSFLQRLACAEVEKRSTLQTTSLPKASKAYCCSQS